MKILDVGSGHKPFEHATHLCDLYPKETAHRDGKIAVIDQRPFIVCDINHLPFKSQCFDYLVCNNVLEHINNPLTGLNELKRISKTGYTQVPSFFSEIFLRRNWTQHKFIVRETKTYPLNSWKYCIKQIIGFFLSKNTHLKFRSKLKKLTKDRLFYKTIIW